MSGATASLRRMNGSAGSLQSVVCTTKASVARCEFRGRIVPTGMVPGAVGLAAILITVDTTVNPTTGDPRTIAMHR